MSAPEHPAPADDKVAIKTRTNFRIEKRGADGEVFEIVEGGDGKPTRVTFRREGEPPESYADVGKK